MTIKVGDRVKINPSPWNSNHIYGMVTKVVEADPQNPEVDHGVVEVRLDAGDTETWVHHNWQRNMTIISSHHREYVLN